MKKIVLFIIGFTFFVGVNADVLKYNKITTKDVNTRNFVLKMGYLKYDTIKKICTYDFCDYMRGSNIYESLEIFTNNYLKTIDDQELVANLKVKGIKITEVILKEE